MLIARHSMQRRQLARRDVLINGQPLPVRASMACWPADLLPRAPVVTVPVREAVSRIGLQLIAAPFNEQACLRAARAMEAMGITDARVAESAA